MTTRKTSQKHEQPEKWAATNCCSPQKFAEIMAKCGEDMEGECCAMMREMMKGESSPPEQK